VLWNFIFILTKNSILRVTMEFVIVVLVLSFMIAETSFIGIVLIRKFYPSGFLLLICFLPRDAILARYMLSLCVCPSVCQSVRSRHCIKTAKRMIIQTKPHDSPVLLYFGAKISAKIPVGLPPPLLRGRKIEVG